MIRKSAICWRDFSGCSFVKQQLSLISEPYMVAVGFLVRMTLIKLSFPSQLLLDFFQAGFLAAHCRILLILFFVCILRIVQIFFLTKMFISVSRFLCYISHRFPVPPFSRKALFYRFCKKSGVSCKMTVLSQFYNSLTWYSSNDCKMPSFGAGCAA